MCCDDWDKYENNVNGDGDGDGEKCDYGRMACRCSTSVEDSLFLMMDLFKKVVNLNDFKDNPARIFAIHRALGRHPRIADIQIRFTVQTNLFCGSVMAFGNDAHRAIIANKDIVGCFALTEKRAGVLSGLVCDTTVSWNEEKQKYILNSPANSPKYWISQGMVAKYAVVFANLTCDRKDKKSKGVQAFFVDMNLPGIKKTEMGDKNVAKFLDNAELFFDNVEIDEDAHMNALVSSSTSSTSTSASFMEIANRLVSGRIILAQCGLVRLQSMVDDARKYAEERESATPGYAHFIDLPFCKDLLDGIENEIRSIKIFARQVEKDYCSSYPKVSNALLENANALKVISNDFVLDSVVELKKKLGSITLFTTFDVDINLFLMYRFAEGDSTILKQKTTRDILKRATSSPFTFIVNYLFACRWKELVLIFYLAFKMMITSKSNQIQQWSRHYQLIDTIAILHNRYLCFHKSK